MPSFCGATEGAYPCHFQFEVLVLVVIMCNVDDPRRLLNTLLKGELAVSQVELLKLRFGDLTAFASRSTIVALG